MSAAVTDFGATSWLSILFGITSLPSNYWIALCQGEPGVDTDGTILSDLEPSDPSYARQLYGASGTQWGANGGHVANLLDVPFGLAALDWGFLDHFALCTAATDGDVWAYGEISQALVVEAGFDVTLSAGAIVLAMLSVDDSITI